MKLKLETKELLRKKENLLFQMKQKKTKIEDDANLVRAKLYKAKKLGVSQVLPNIRY